MQRTTLIAAIGTGAAAVGAFLTLRANALATRWESLGDGAWGGTTDPAVRQQYYFFGLIVLCFGLVLLAVAAWNWIQADHNDRFRPPGSP